MVHDEYILQRKQYCFSSVRAELCCQRTHTLLLEHSFVAFDEIVHMESTLAHQMKKTHARDALSHGTDVPSHGTVLNTDTVIL